MSGESAIEGGKAAGLRALSRAGLPVPAWHALDPVPVPNAVCAAMAQTGPPSRAELARAAAAMRALPVPDMTSVLAAEPGPFVVRSSATLEDLAGGSAAGLFESVRDVARADLADAVRRVRASAASPAVWAYLAARELSFDDLRIGAIVQVQVAPALESGTAYTHHPTDPDCMLIESTAGWRAPRRDDRADDVAQLARAAAAAIGVGAADVEWVRNDAGPWLVQARPVPSARRPPGPPANAFAALAADPHEWRWDVEHNPEPLSPAQAGLVDLVAGDSMRVVCGYLYARAVPHAPAPAALDLTPLGDMRRILDAAEHAAVGVPAALDAYAAVYERYTELAGPLAAARRELPATIAAALGPVRAGAIAQTLLGSGSSAHLEPLIAAVARGDLDRAALDEVAGPMAPAWDVATPTYAERPELLAAAIAAAADRAAAPHPRAADATAAMNACLDQIPAGVRADLPPLIDRARRAADAAELDDRCLFRAQALVRRALASAGGDDAFWVPLPQAAAGRFDSAVAERARQTWCAQRALTMPLAVRRGRALPVRATRDDNRWSGRGVGGQTTGIAWRIDGAASCGVAPDGAIAIAAAVTPATTILLHGAAALVSEHGGVLDHGAAIARELGIPCVVDCAGVFADLRTGDRVWVDADAGVVIRLSGS